MPVQYVLGEWDFQDLTLKMKPPVFIPRPETEVKHERQNELLRHSGACTYACSSPCDLKEAPSETAIEVCPLSWYELEDILSTWFIKVRAQL